MNATSNWLAALALLSGPLVVSAQPVTYYFTGIVTGATGIYVSTAGPTVTGTFTINVGVGEGIPVNATGPWNIGSGPAPPSVVVSTLQSGSVTFSDAGFGGNESDVEADASSGSNVTNEYVASDLDFTNGVTGFVYSTFQLFGGTGANAPFDASGLPVFANATGGAYGAFSYYPDAGSTASTLRYTITSLTPRGPAAGTPSLSGTTIPSASQIVDLNLNVWKLSGGVAYRNDKPTPSSGVILLLCYGGIVYQENTHHDWWLWVTNTDPRTGISTSTWAASMDPRVISASGTTIPVATQIIDSELDLWTLSGGKAYKHGQLTPSSGVILLLYAKGLVYQENSHHDWWFWRNGAWVATTAPLTPSESGTGIPSATEIIDNGRNVWTLSGGKAYENHALTPSSSVILLLFYGGNVYQENAHHNWWEWNGQAWISTASDPRVGQPLAYVASPTAGGKHSVTVIDTGANRVKATIPIGFEASYIAVTPDAKHVYGAGNLNYTNGSVAVIDTAQEKVLNSILVPYDPQGVVASPDGTRVYVVLNRFLIVQAALFQR